MRHVNIHIHHVKFVFFQGQRLPVWGQLDAKHSGFRTIPEEKVDG